MNPKPTNIPQYLLAALRIYLGVILLITDIGKLTAGSPFSDEMVGFFKAVIPRESPFYVHFLRAVVIPNATLFSYLIMTGELVAGIGLLTGLLTRLSALIAMVLFVNYMFAKGLWFWSPNSQDAAVFFIALAVLIGRSGRVIGLDYFLARRKPNSLLW